MEEGNLKIKYEFDNIVNSFNDIYRVFEYRFSEELTELIDLETFEKFKLIITELQNIDIERDSDFEDTIHLLDTAKICLDSIGTNEVEILREDESLKSLLFTVMQVSECAGLLEINAREIRGDGAMDLARIASRIDQSAQIKASYLAPRVDELEQVL